MRSCNLCLVFIVLMIHSNDGSPVSLQPSEEVQYVFNVPSQLAAGSRKQLQTAITNLQEQVTLMSRRLRLMEAGGNITAVQDMMPSISGTNYVHWGRKSCPAGRNLIYIGLGAKAYSSHTGGGIDYQCLTNDPEDPDGVAAGSQGNSYIYGVEYYAYTRGIVGSSDLYNDLPCSVCEVPTKTQTLMIPSKRTCPTGWTKEYDGYLMAERYNHASPSNFICVDKYFEFIHRGVGAQTSGYVYPVEINCGIIPCPPYTAGKELSCVMCSK